MITYIRLVITTGNNNLRSQKCIALLHVNFCLKQSLFADTEAISNCFFSLSSVLSIIYYI